MGFIHEPTRQALLEKIETTGWCEDTKVFYRLMVEQFDLDVFERVQSAHISHEDRDKAIEDLATNFTDITDAADWKWIAEVIWSTFEQTHPAFKETVQAAAEVEVAVA
jgi:hypothetical protein